MSQIIDCQIIMGKNIFYVLGSAHFIVKTIVVEKRSDWAIN